MKYFSFEGVSCAGKSTIVNSIAEQFKAATVPEITAYCRCLLKQPTKNPEVFFKNAKIKLKVDLIRSSYMKKLGELSKYIFIDRSFLSTLVLTMSMANSLNRDTVNKLIDTEIEAIKNNELKVSDVYIYLYTNSQIAQERNELRPIRLDDYWVSTDLINRQIEIFDYLVNKKIFNKVDASYCERSLVNICVKEIISSNFYTVTSGQIIDALEELKRF